MSRLRRWRVLWPVMGESRTPSPDPDHHAAGTDQRVPSRLVRTLAGALLVEAALFVAAAVILLAGLVRGSGGSDDGAAAAPIGMTVFLVLSAAGLAVVLVAAAWALTRGRRRGRAAALTWQLFQAVVAVSALASGSLGPALLGILLLALAAGVVALLFVPRVVEETTRR